VDLLFKTLNSGKKNILGKGKIGDRFVVARVLK
jgi:hypothetical protein